MLMLKEMEYVYAVYEEQSFSKAARKLYLSQPALSAAVRRAEAEIHTPIFDRSTNPIRLTAAGTYYIDAVKRILDIRQELESYFDALAGECRGSVRVGAASFFCAHVLPDIAEEFQRQYPAWRASMLEVNAPDLYPCLQSGTIDLSLSVEAADPRLFHSTVWHEEQILLAVPAAFSVNRGLETFQLTAAQVREGGPPPGGLPGGGPVPLRPGALPAAQAGERPEPAGRTSCAGTRASAPRPSWSWTSCSPPAASPGTARGAPSCGTAWPGSWRTAGGWSTTSWGTLPPTGR